MKPTAKKTAGAAPPAPAPDVPHVPQADPLGLIPGVNDDPNVPPPDDEPTVIIPPPDDHVPGLDPAPPAGLTADTVAKLRDKFEAATANDDEETVPISGPFPEKPGVVVTKDGRARTVIRAELPPPPPEPRAGRALRKSDIGAAYYHRLNPGENYAALSLEDQKTWYERAINAGGSI